MIVYSPPPDLGSTVCYADDWLIVADKPSGLLSVPGRGPDKADCLVARVQREFADALTVHRLDMSTSGLILFGRGAEMQSHFSRLFRERLVDKSYVALVAGLLADDAGEVDLPMIVDWPNRPRQMVNFEIGKPSLTRYRVLERDAQRQTTRVALEPVTGRSHQLRVHMAALGHPILGDELYGDESSAPRLLLHAAELAFVHPSTAKRIEFHSPAPF
ncbi:MAG: RluA family pseudouridine synthase [Rhodocyclales bacterium]|nr:RluA family pseudouridine synthase [Rhodocyclales bacterium]